MKERILEIIRNILKNGRTIKSVQQSNIKELINEQDYNEILDYYIDLNDDERITLFQGILQYRPIIGNNLKIELDNDIPTVPF